VINKKTLIAILAPGCVFQSVMVGGGYGTGREVVQYFTQYGLWGGIGAILISFLMFSTLLAFMFEAARVFSAYDYKSLFKPILGPLFPIFEGINILMLTLVMAILGAASAQILQDNLNVPHFVGLAIMIIPIAALTFMGGEFITKVLVWWSAYLYIIFIAFLVIALGQTDSVSQAFTSSPSTQDGWAISGLQYAFYNCAAAPFILYTVKSINTRGIALITGIVAAAIAIVPALLFHVAMITQYDMVLAQDLPIYAMIEQFGSSLFLMLFSIMLFGTFIETGAGILQGVNDRVDAYFLASRGKALSRSAHAGMAVLVITISALLSQLGVKDLIAQGYGTIAWVYLFVFIIPMFVFGTRKILAKTK